MAFTGDENHEISLADATRFTANYREQHGNDFLGGFFGKSVFSKILDQQDCVGIRVYNAVNDDGNRSFVLVGVTADGKDMFDGELAEFNIGCPPDCPGQSPLTGSD